MTFYHQQVLKIKEQYFPKEYLYQQVIRAKQFIDAHFAGNIILNDMAGEAFYSKFHFIRLFKSIYGQTPHQYLTTVRINKAKQLLKAGIPVTEVCFSVGFDSASSFTGLFKKVTGVMPSSYFPPISPRAQKIAILKK